MAAFASQDGAIRALAEAGADMNALENGADVSTWKMGDELYEEVCCDSRDS